MKFRDCQAVDSDVNTVIKLFGDLRTQAKWKCRADRLRLDGRTLSGFSSAVEQVTTAECQVCTGRH